MRRMKTTTPNRRRIPCAMLAAGMILLACLSGFPAGSDACTSFYAGCETTANGSVYVCRSEDYGPDYVKHFVIVPAADHEPGELFEDDFGFCAPYPQHTLRYSAVMDDPSEYGGIAKIPFGEGGINEKGVSVSATISTEVNDFALQADPLTAGGITEMSMASWILQSAESAADGVRILAACIDTYGHGNSEPDEPVCREASTVLIADPQETWVFEIVSGHQYIATRLSDDTVSLNPNAIMTQQADISDENIVASRGLISTAKEGGFYATEIEGDHQIHVAKSYGRGYEQYASYRFYYAAYSLNREMAEAIEVVPVPAGTVADLYPFASAEEVAAGPFCLEYQPSEEVAGTIDLAGIRRIYASHGEGTAFETTSGNVAADGTVMRSIGTYRQNEIHIFEVRRNRSLPVSVCTVEWLAMGRSEFSVYVPFYAAAMTAAPACYTTEVREGFDPGSVYWLFNEIGNTGTGRYYRKGKDGSYYDRNGETVDAETAEAVLRYLSDSSFIDRLHAETDRLQEEMNAMFNDDDGKMAALAATASDAEVSAMADLLAEKYAGRIQQAATDLLAAIDRDVSGFIESISHRETRPANQRPLPPISLTRIQTSGAIQPHSRK